MKHSDIYTKFMIEYDKANVTSSYPSLTRYEIATILDKAYLAIIAQKLTGNNPRQVPFEGDTKAIEDIRPLLTNATLSNYIKDSIVDNLFKYDIPSNLLYYINGSVEIVNTTSSIDDNRHVILPVSLISHVASERFKATANNLPWMKNPVAYTEGKNICLLIDLYKYKYNHGSMKLSVTYIKIPAKFVNDSDNTEFELSDSMAEELINLAIIMSTEIVESPRISTKTNIRQLES